MMITETYPEQVIPVKQDKSRFQEILDNLGFGFTVDIQTYSFYDEDEYRYAFTIFPDHIRIKDIANGDVFELNAKDIETMAPRDSIPAEQLVNLVVNLTKNKLCGD